MKFSINPRTVAPVLAAGLLALGAVSAPAALAGEPSGPLPGGGDSGWTVDQNGEYRYQKPDRKPSTTKTPYYANCAAAHAAGVTVLYAGQTGYGAHLDPDLDGIACEVWEN
ncbi:excalibur calcium-binding domain-containing protein [Nocardia sp. CDC159]|uniref:Excalibur calcium-binding domain-containing protein n=1 Tax=Nocardia pulmonis TaxID=2951408 RepID=A0A9X2J0R9_9NOCA|nr:MULTISPECIES: excalibur calcium-binding domain-containing protein [Nocardia]MCM6777325.1 excalibur calcium-binding domain-containing protein [Nocardia pulmonis]MCM6790210.1 excalibur calcium-binding domain-containing protein [Nocardia sp. CDC159]